LSSGKGDLSRLYKTTDGCKTWKLVFTNADKDGFWDALKFTGKAYGTLIADPVNGYFSIFETHDGGLHWHRQKNVGAGVPFDGVVFAASNSGLVQYDGAQVFGIGGPTGNVAYYRGLKTRLSAGSSKSQ
jgi:photosystem II stability/assembly factor-like uncharacterized protein